MCAVLVLAIAAPAPSARPMPDSQAPVIFSIKIDKTDLRSGDVISGMVVTSLSVASVEARIGGYGVGVPKVAPGRFALRYTVPWVPWFWHKEFAMDIIARNTAGAAVRRSVNINIH